MRENFLAKLEGTFTPKSVKRGYGSLDVSLTARLDQTSESLRQIEELQLGARCAIDYSGKGLKRVVHEDFACWCVDISFLRTC